MSMFGQFCHLKSAEKVPIKDFRFQYPPHLDETNERSGMVTEELPSVSGLNVVWPNFTRFSLFEVLCSLSSLQLHCHYFA